MLEALVRNARERGVSSVEPRLRHGVLIDTLTELEQGVRLFVLGKRGEHADFAKMHHFHPLACRLATIEGESLTR